jgi:hypothetical protein
MAASPESTLASLSGATEDQNCDDSAPDDIETS